MPGLFRAGNQDSNPARKAERQKQMTNVITFQSKAPMQTASLTRFDEMPDAIEPRAAFSFDMSQPTPGGLVLLDACVPLELALEFMNLVNNYREQSVA
jgi:hypothetical protein